MMDNSQILAGNVARLRAERDLTQAKLAERAGVSRITLGKIERGDVVPRAETLTELAKALRVDLADLVSPVSSLSGVRFRERSRVNTREQILAEVARWLETYNWLERKLDCPQPFKLEHLVGSKSEPKEVADAARKNLKLKDDEPIRDICGLLEDSGVKLLLLQKASDAFFGLSVSAGGAGPAVVVNTWDRISVERWIFTAAHELGHILLHEGAFDRSKGEEVPAEEKDSDLFASYFLMPIRGFRDEWEQARGLPLIRRVLKLKRIYRVSYKTVLYRLVESELADKRVWGLFQKQHKDLFGTTLRHKDEGAGQLEKSEFRLNWNRSGEPDGLSSNDFVDDRLSRLVRTAFENDAISLSRAAEILGTTSRDMRKRAAAWSN